MEKTLFKGIILITCIWFIWNSSKGITEIANTNVKDSQPIPEAQKPQPQQPEKEGKKAFHMRKVES